MDAPVAIIEFSDFECPSCGGAESAVRDVLTKYPSQVRFIFKHFPLPIHSHAEPAHEAALAAGAQGRFWEMHDLLFSNQTRLERYDLLQYAQRLNLDVHVYTLALSTHAYRPTVEENLAEARALGVSATPTFFVNGTRLLGLQTRDALEGAVRQTLGFGTNRSPKLSGQAKDPDVH